MKATGVWHASHEVAGIIKPTAQGPIGKEACTVCGAKRWANPEAFSAACGGSIDEDAAVGRKCKGKASKGGADAN